MNQNGKFEWKSLTFYLVSIGGITALLSVLTDKVQWGTLVGLLVGLILLFSFSKWNARSKSMSNSAVFVDERIHSLWIKTVSSFFYVYLGITLIICLTLIGLHIYSIQVSNIILYLFITSITVAVLFAITKRR